MGDGLSVLAGYGASVVVVVVNMVVVNVGRLASCVLEVSAF